jgi:hypothetical protein
VRPAFSGVSKAGAAMGNGAVGSSPTTSIREGGEMDRMRARHYTVLEDEVIGDERLGPFELLVYVALRRHVNADGECWPSWARLAKIARCSRSKAAEALAGLETQGYLMRRSRLGSSTVYTVLEPPVQVVDGTRPGGGLPPVQVVDPEVSSLEVPPMKNIPRTPARAAKRAPVDPATKEIRDLFLAEEAWPAPAREATNLKRLIGWAKEREGDRYVDFLHHLLQGVTALKLGEVMGLSNRDREFWAQQPFTPSAVLANAARICSALESLGAANRVPTEAELGRLLVGIK